MKKVFTLCLIITVLTAKSFGQETAIATHFEPVKSTLSNWDKVRGEWLAESMVNMATNKPTPDRTFPEEFTPAEMFSAMPEETQRKVRHEISQEAARYASNSEEQKQWGRVTRFVSKTPTCKAVMGRTYGDPHLTSFDDASYDFQTVGEFTLAQSGSGHLNIQARQRNFGDNFSLNTATAMYVDGDRIGFYAEEKPDGNTTTPLRIEGEAVYIDEGSTYFLEHGGTISKSNGDYTVTWPTGEKALLDFRQTNGMGFMNIAVEVFPCTDTYDGILGNANGNSRDDYNPRGSTSRLTWNTSVFGSTNSREQEMEKEYLAFLAKDYARSYRITPEISLFDYGFNQSTFAFTDESYPRVYHTIGDLSTNDMSRARKTCERQGFSGPELSACIYDQGFLRIEPTPKPTFPDRTTGRTLNPVTTPTPNVNPGQKPYSERYPQKNPELKGNVTNGNAQPIGQTGGKNTTGEKIESSEKPAVNPTINGNGKSVGTKTPVGNTSIGTPIGQKVPETSGTTVKKPETTTSGTTSGTTIETKTPTTQSGNSGTTVTTKPVSTSTTNSGNSSSGTVSKPSTGNTNTGTVSKPSTGINTGTKVNTTPVKTTPVKTTPPTTTPVKTTPTSTPVLTPKGRL